MALSSRSSVVSGIPIRLSHSVPRISWHAEYGGPGVRCQVSKTREEFDKLMHKAKEKTFSPPSGQLHGRSGRRSALEDGERMLIRCIQMEGEEIEGYLVLMQNLEVQNRGRELEIPKLSIAAIKNCGTSLSSANARDVRYVQQIVKMGMDVLSKQGNQEQVDGYRKALEDSAPQFKNVLNDVT